LKNRRKEKEDAAAKKKSLNSLACRGNRSLLEREKKKAGSQGGEKYMDADHGRRKKRGTIPLAGSKEKLQKGASCTSGMKDGTHQA